jgi:hypothetical protein
MALELTRQSVLRCQKVQLFCCYILILIAESKETRSELLLSTAWITGQVTTLSPEE